MNHYSKLLKFIMLFIFSQLSFAQNLTVQKPGYYSGFLSQYDNITFDLGSDYTSHVFFDYVSTASLSFQDYASYSLQFTSGTNYTFASIQGLGHSYYITEFHPTSQIMTEQMFFEIWVIPSSRCHYSLALTGYPYVNYDGDSSYHLVNQSACVFAPGKASEDSTEITYKFTKKEKGTVHLYDESSHFSFSQTFNTTVYNPIYMVLSPEKLQGWNLRRASRHSKSKFQASRRGDIPFLAEICRN